MRAMNAAVCLLFLLSYPLAGAEITLRGRVVDEADRPLAGARVELRPLLDLHHTGLRLLAGETWPDAVARRRTDREGAFEIAVPEIGLWRISVEAEGRVPMSRSFRPLLKDEALADVRLLAAEAIDVRVTAGGEPLAGALVDAVTPGEFEPWQQGYRSGRWWPLRRAAFTGEDGRATLWRAAPEKPEVRAMRPGFPGRRIAGADLPATGALEIALEAGTARTLELVDSKGEPAAGVLFLDVWRPLGITGDDGSVELTAADLERQPLHLTLTTGDGWRNTLTALEAEDTVLPLPPPLEVGGRVTDGEGRPIAGAIVWRQRGPAAMTRTGVRGHFRWPTAGERLQLGFAAEGFQPHRLEVVVADEAASDLAVILEPAAAIFGLVADEDGLPVAAARVEARGAYANDRSWNRRGGVESTLTSDDGRFRLGGLPAGELWQIRVTGEGYAPAAATAAAGAAELEIVLRRGATLVGEVVGPGGQGVAGARVRLSHLPAEGEARLEIAAGELLSAPEAVTGEAGRFAVHGLPAGEHSAEFQRPGYARRTVPGIRVDEAQREVDLGTIRLAEAADVAALVTGPDGEPIAGVTMRIMSAPEPALRRSSRTPETLETDARGFVRYGDLAAGDRVDLWFEHPAWVELRLEGVEAPTAEPLAVVLSPGATVSGVVEREDGQGIPRVRLRADSSVVSETPSQASQRRLTKWGQSEPGGRFTLRGLHPGEVRLTAQLKGFAEETLALRLAEGEQRDDLRIVLKRGATVSGRLFDPKAQPVAGGTVWLSRTVGEQQSGSQTSTTDGEGRFRIEGWPPGPSELQARHPEVGAAKLDVELASGPNAVDLTLAAARFVSGRVVDAEGRPLAGSQVELATGSSSTTKGVEADGAFSFDPGEPGDYRLSAWRDDLARTTQTVRVGEGPISGLELVLRTGATITGQVLGATPEERGRIQIWASTSDSHHRRSSTVGVDGSYRISGLRADTWRLEATMPGSARRAAATVEVQGADLEVVRDLELSGGDLTLTGTALLNGAPEASVQVWIQSPGGSVNVWGTTNSRGRFRFEGLEPGAYLLRLVGEWGNYEETVELWSDLDVEVSLGLSAVAGRVSTGAGEPLAGVHLMLFPDDTPTARSAIGNQASSAAGAFAFSRVRDGRYRLLATKDGYATTTAAVEVAGADVLGLEVTLADGAALLLEVLAPSGAPPASIQVVAQDAAGRTLAYAETLPRPDGRFEITTVPAGAWRLLIYAAGAAPVHLDAVEVPGGPYAVVLEPRTLLKVIVPALAGEHGPATLLLTDAAGRPFTPARLGFAMDRWQLSRGEIALPSLPPGTWGLRVEGPAGAVWSGTATTQEGRPAEVVLE